MRREGEEKTCSISRKVGGYKTFKFRNRDKGWIGG